MLQLRDQARQWWHSHIASGAMGIGLVTWGGFAQAFMDRYVSSSVRDRLRQEFNDLGQGDRSIDEYVDRFFELSRYAMAILPNEREDSEVCARVVFVLSGAGFDYFQMPGATLHTVIEMDRSFEQFRMGSSEGRAKRVRCDDRGASASAGGKISTRLRGRFRQRGPYSAAMQASGSSKSVQSTAGSSQKHTGSQAHSSGRGGQSSSQQIAASRACFTCGQIGHYARQCQSASSSGAQQAPQSSQGAGRSSAPGGRGRSGGRGAGTCRGQGHPPVAPTAERAQC